MKIKNLAALWLGFALAVSFSCNGKSPKVADAEEAGMSKVRLKLIDGLVEAAVDRGDFPGAVVLVGRKDRIVYRKAFGRSQVVPVPEDMEENMIFDLASLTKPVATATSVMILVEEGRLSLTEKVKDFVPGFEPWRDENGNPGEEARLWHLLTHTSGLPDYTAAAEAAKTLGEPVRTSGLVRYIAGLEKKGPAGKQFLYSCLGYITLGHIVEKVSGRPLDEFTTERIFKPLDMKHTFFTPSEKTLGLCVPTQVVDGKPRRGVVDDSLSRLQGGVSGNAGLFSTADDLALFCRMILNKGTLGGKRILSPLAVGRMTEVHQGAVFSGRGLGWDLDSSFSTNSGDLFGPDSFGHTGYTGTSLWIDPQTGVYVIFLANRVHPKDKGSVVAMRSRLANVAASAVEVE